jgi:alkanesulfonate monooxygenase SsuD/methylene tetrahydromethanopterin reductase-like flavin-dependent oxidoreductase (luciferase family)
MKFGIFDYIDRRDDPLSKTYEQRFELIRAAEAHGFYGYHVTEHHFTPLSSTPSPSVFLAAAARETSTIRIGALLYLLPMYNIARLIEEIGMLDSLSGGRLDVGVGRGISPHEFGALGLDVTQSQEQFEEALEVLVKGLSSDVLDHHGKHYQFDRVPMVWRPVQKPHPPLWYGLRTTEGMARPAHYGMNGVTLGPTDNCAKTLANFRAAWAEHAGDAQQQASPVKQPLAGVVRAMFIAETDAEAERIARPAYKQWFDALAWLWVQRGDYPPIALSADYDKARAMGTFVVGSPESVRRELVAQAEKVGFDYLVLQLAFGSLGHENEMRSLQLFAKEVMPALQRVGAASPVQR